MALKKVEKRVDDAEPNMERAKVKEKPNDPLKLASKPFVGASAHREQKKERKRTP
ncbi:MAG: hypothetical protein HOD92_16640 [Deltaproteobacteria bacterium]|jgi:hypothetical protein|nr:hypothetical protein [Deltaproteobacteria bacterium]